MLRSRARSPFRPVERRVLDGHWASVTFGCPPHWDGRERAGAQANRVRALKAMDASSSVSGFTVDSTHPPTHTLCSRCAFKKKKEGSVNTVTFLFLVRTVADAFGTSWRGHACFREPRFPGGRALGNGGLGLEVLLGKQRRRRPRRPPLLARGSREAGRPSGDAARSRARGRRGGAVARGCRLVPAAVGLVPSPATEGAPAGPPQRRLHSGQRDSNPGAFE